MLEAARTERDVLTWSLDWYRAVVERKVDGMPTEIAAQVVTGSGLSPLGVVQHLAHAERNWFQGTFAGRDIVRIRPPGGANDVEFVIQAGTTVDDVVALYRAETQAARDIVAAASLDDLSVNESTLFGTVSLRWIVVHMLEETARHAGHLDIMCEQLDGRTGD